MNQKKIEEIKKFEGKTLSLYLSKFESKDKVLKREIIKRKNAVGIIAITPKNKIILVKQFRQPVEECLWEIPAGIIDGDESAGDTAHRELIEETGYKAHKVNELIHYYSSPGFTDEEVIIYKATGLDYVGSSPEEEEEFESEELDIERAIEMISEGRIIDAKSIIAILLVANEQTG